MQGALEELDAVNEYFYDAAAGKLYFMPNTTDQNADGSPRVDLAEVPAIANFFSLFGAEEAPVTNVSFQGITFTGGRPTMFDPHGQPSGGDWALERMGAILLEGTEDVIVADCLFERIDSNAVFLSGYNRRAQVVRNEFSLLGNNAVASWGRSVDWDGTGGQQPRHSLIMGNIVHDIGLEQKQSSFYFQAQSCENTLAANIVYNIPRAAVNASTGMACSPPPLRAPRVRSPVILNLTRRSRPTTQFEDGFGGANVLTDNLFWNSCRESSDHGAFNRQVHSTTTTTTTTTTTPSPHTHIHAHAHTHTQHRMASLGRPAQSRPV